MSEKLLEVRNLHTYFYTDHGIARAVNGVSFDVPKNTTIGIVGESGCGKSVMARSVLRILGKRGKIVEGEILFHSDGTSVDLAGLDLKGPVIRKIRGDSIAMIFQEPMSSMSPVYTVGNQIMEAILLHQKVDKQEARQIAVESLRKVEIPKPEQRIEEYPYQLSGGMLQRAMIAMALSCQPAILIADEPTTALDVTTQAQILDLLRQLQSDMGMSIIIITHDLGVIAEMASEVAVMYMGKIVEKAPSRELFTNPLHPYTGALFKSIPHITREVVDRLESIKGIVPDVYNIPNGCAFHPRCPLFEKGLCDSDEPGLRELEPEHLVSCFVVQRDKS